MIKTVVFDFADTIAKLSPSKEVLLQQFIKEKIGVDIAIKRIEETYFYVQNLYFYSSVKTRVKSEKKLFYKDYNKKIFSNLGVLHLIETYLDEYFEYFNGMEKHWILKEGVLALFKELKARDIDLGLISNFDSVLYGLLDDLGVSRYLSYIHVSQDIGLEKPNIAFYQKFIEKYNLITAEILYIGDNYELDYLPARQLGFKVLLLDEAKHYSETLGEKSSVDNLTKLSEYL